MHYLIDGHNLIAQVPDISLDDPNDEIKLVLRLQSWAARRRQRRITVIFDGGLPGGKSLRFSNASVKVLFASVGQTADTLLIKRIRRVKNPPEYTLVSNDREIVAAAEERRMPHLRSEAFAAELSDEARSAAKARTETPDDADDPHVSEDEVAEWLALFGPVPETTTVNPERSTKVSKGRPKKPKKKKRTPSGDLRSAKRSDGKLSADEVDEWLDLFGNREV
jgi:predicted RNA-binding protein with PIN domain